MSLFIGDYKTFYKFVDGYARNKTLALTKKYKSGICACCGTKSSKGNEIQSAHRRGFERCDLVRKFFDDATIKEENGVYQVDLDKFEKLFLDFTSNVSNFFFLCQNCHSKYDSGLLNESDFKYLTESKKVVEKKSKIQNTLPKLNKVSLVNNNLKDKLRVMGKSWFVSYMYFLFIDDNHKNWKNAGNFNSRISVFKQSKIEHKKYLLEILNSSGEKLKTNNLGLSGLEILDITKKLLANWDNIVKDEFYKGVF